MKKILILFLYLFPIALYNVNAQRIIVNNDSLRIHFRNEPPHKVLEYYSKNWIHVIDYKALYYDEELKNYLMQWLDKEVIVDFSINNLRKQMSERFNYDKNTKKQFLMEYLYSELRIDYDSICTDTVKLNFYLEEAINSLLKYNKKAMFEQKLGINLFIPDAVLVLHSQIVYIEAYTKIKQWWYENNKETITENGRISKLFYHLLLMNDSEAHSIFDKIIKDIVDKKSDYDVYNVYIQLTEGRQNAYFIKKLLELLSVKIEFEYLAGYEATYYKPLDILIYNEFKQIFNAYNIGMDIFNFPYKTEKEYTKEIRKRKNIIIERTQELIQKLEAEEQYWMENMPFDYVPQLVK